MKEVIFRLGIVTYDDMPTIGLNNRGDVGTGRVKMTYRTPFDIIVQLSHAFAKRIPRLGDHYDIFEHIVKGIRTDPYELGSLVMEGGPTESEKKDGWRNGVMVNLAATEGAGCINWIASVSHIFYNVNGAIISRRVW